MKKINISEEELNKEIKLAKKAGKEAYLNEPRAVSVKYNKKTGRVIIDLVTGVSFMFPASMAEELVDVSKSDLSDVSVLADGFAIYWGKIDVALSVPDLLKGIFGSKAWMKKLQQNLLLDKKASFA
jgi:hypothetical protein